MTDRPEDPVLVPSVRGMACMCSAACAPRRVHAGQKQTAPSVAGLCWLGSSHAPSVGSVARRCVACELLEAHVPYAWAWGCRREWAWVWVLGAEVEVEVEVLDGVLGSSVAKQQMQGRTPMACQTADVGVNPNDPYAVDPYYITYDMPNSRCRGGRTPMTCWFP